MNVSGEMLARARTNKRTARMLAKARKDHSKPLEGVEFELVSSAKVLGVCISSDLKWSAHIDSITTKAAKRLYLLRQLKRAGIAHSVLVRFFCSVIRSILEYACQVFHCNLPLYLSEEIERIQGRALRVIFPDCSYSEGLAKAGLTTLYDRRSTLCKEP